MPFASAPRPGTPSPFSPFWAGLVLTALAACAPSPRQEPPPPPAAVAPAEVRPAVLPPAAPKPAPAGIRLSGDLAAEVAALPGVAVLEETPFSFGYPGQSLFGSGAALPLPGGTEVLEPLSDWLRTHPDLRWRAEVRARTAHGADYDAALASRRAEILRRYLRNRGVPDRVLVWQEEAGDGPPLQLILREEPPAAPSPAR